MATLILNHFEVKLDIKYVTEELFFYVLSITSSGVDVFDIWNITPEQKG
ncbi:MAG: hypothetical protein IPF95_16400 [Flavobacteriales bacterium]|nr:hypothetical protein [Flavobacteriales bacterium]MBK6945586.1 hypothetical protein [Flavobacteriales bacterium]MBK7296308.1 hypothetical protein [Flavobacteriales bacterium]HQV53721.1 hypothetical protein [Flavobacteriales bacterium]